MDRESRPPDYPDLARYRIDEDYDQNHDGAADHGGEREPDPAEAEVHSGQVTRDGDLQQLKGARDGAEDDRDGDLPGAQDGFSLDEFCLVARSLHFHHPLSVASLHSLLR